MPRLTRGVAKVLNQRLPLTLPGSVGISLGGLTGLANQSQVASMTAYSQLGSIFAIVNRIAESTAMINWSLYRGGASMAGSAGPQLLATTDESLAQAAKEPDHPFMQLWRRPNPFYTRHEFIQTFQQHLELAGEAWWVIAKGSREDALKALEGDLRDKMAELFGTKAPGPSRPNAPQIELWPIRPDRMRPIPSRDNFIAGYEYRLGAEKIPLALDDVIFLKIPNPLDPFRGLGVVQSLMTDVDSERFAAQWNRQFFLNSAEPGGIIEYDKNLDDVTFNKQLLRWREQHQGVSQAHRVAIIEAGHWIDRKYTQRDMQFEQLRKLNRDLMLFAWGMHGAIMGLSEHVNRANADAADVAFGRWTLTPRLVRIKDATNEKLIPLFGNDLFLGYADPTPADRETDAGVADIGAKHGGITYDEFRNYLGLGPLPDRVMGATLMPVAGPASPFGGGGEDVTTPAKFLRKWPAVMSEREADQLQGWEGRLAAAKRQIFDYLDQFDESEPVTRLPQLPAGGGR